MDIEITQAINELGSRIDRLDAEMKSGLTSLRTEMQREFAGVRVDVTGLREGLQTNWSRTQALFERLRVDIQMLAGHASHRVSRRPRS
jgi:hypothetical protein